jgi:hypothetical protein
MGDEEGELENEPRGIDGADAVAGPVRAANTGTAQGAGKLRSDGVELVEREHLKLPPLRFRVRDEARRVSSISFARTAEWSTWRKHLWIPNALRVGEGLPPCPDVRRVEAVDPDVCPARFAVERRTIERVLTSELERGNRRGLSDVLRGELVDELLLRRHVLAAPCAVRSGRGLRVLASLDRRGLVIVNDDGIALTFEGLMFAGLNGR